MYQFTWIHYKLLVKYIELLVNYIVEFILLRYYFIIQNFRNYLIIIPFDISFIFE